jgi:hypothetical protein
MTMPNEVIARYLIDAALVSDPDVVVGEWPLYVGTLPDDEDVPDDIAAVFTTPGIIHGKDMSGGQHQHYGVQLRFRSCLETDGYDKASELVTQLLQLHREEVEIGSGEVYEIASISQTSDIVKIVKDEKDRTHLTVNLIVAYVRTV